MSRLVGFMLRGPIRIDSDDARREEVIAKCEAEAVSKLHALSDDINTVAASQCAGPLGYWLGNLGMDCNRIFVRSGLEFDPTRYEGTIRAITARHYGDFIRLWNGEVSPQPHGLHEQIMEVPGCDPFKVVFAGYERHEYICQSTTYKLFYRADMLGIAGCLGCH